MAQGKDDGSAPLTPQVGDGEYAGGSNTAPCKRKWLHAGAVLFLLVNVIVLYILHFVDSNASRSNAVSGSFKSSALSDTSSKAKTGLAVSYGADGKLRVGAGTTAYLDATSFAESDKIAYMSFAPMGTSEAAYDTNIIAYQVGEKASIATVVSTVSVDTEAKSVSISDDKTTIQGDSVKGISTLSDSLAVLLTTAASDGSSRSAYTTPITLANNGVSVQQAKRTMLANGSATSFITPLSDKQFAAVYFQPWVRGAVSYQEVKVGSISSDNAITFSKGFKFGGENSDSDAVTFGQPFKVLKADGHFTVPWFSHPAMGDANLNGTSAGLCLTTFAYDAAGVKQANEVCNPKYIPDYFIDTTKLSDNVLALAFADANNKYALTIVTVEFSEISFKPTFRSAAVIDEATGKFDFGASYGFSPEPSIEALADNRLAVAFFNPANTGKPSIKVFKYSSDLALSVASPVLPIANADFKLATAATDAQGSLTIDLLPVASGFVVGYCGKWADAATKRVSFIESFGEPVGVITDSGSTMSVAMAGTTGVDADLETGRAYYAATSGKLYTPSTETDDKFVLVEQDKIVISRDALVGVAVSGSKLFISAQAN